MINEWNDRHSPEKISSRGRPKISHSINEADALSISPEIAGESLPTSPAKKDKQAVQRRKLFGERKHATAVSFLKELDEKITGGQITALACSSGGVHIVWSKKLISTAGRANWKRETLRSRSSDGVTASTTYRHHASIELAEKIIDDEGKRMGALESSYKPLTSSFRTSFQRNRPRILPSCQLHDHWYQRQPSR